MKNRKLYTFIIILCSAITGRALTWETTECDFSTEAGVHDLPFAFNFKNERSEPVTITELKSSCGCADPKVESTEIPAGGTGTIKVVYSPGDRVGPQTARIIVATNEKGVEPVSLDLKINLQPAISLAPRLVFWKKTDGLTTQVVQIKSVGKTPLRVLSVTSLDATITAELKTGLEPETWQLALTPKSIKKTATIKVEIRAEVGGLTAIYSIFCVLR